DQERADYHLIRGDVATAAPAPAPVDKRGADEDLGKGSSVAMTPDGSWAFLAGRNIGRRLQMSKDGGPFQFAPAVTKEVEGTAGVAAGGSVLAFTSRKEHVAKLGYAPLGAGAAKDAGAAAPAGPAGKGAETAAAAAAPAAAEPASAPPLDVKRTKVKLPE